MGCRVAGRDGFWGAGRPAAGRCVGVDVGGLPPATPADKPPSAVPGTIMDCWHFGHLTDLPTRSSQAEKFLPQCWHVRRIGTCYPCRLFGVEPSQSRASGRAAEPGSESWWTCNLGPNSTPRIIIAIVAYKTVLITMVSVKHALK